MARSVTAIQADLDAFCALRTQAAAHGIAEYQVDDGQGRQMVKRITLGEINSTLKALNDEMAEASSSANGSGAVALGFSRY